MVCEKCMRTFRGVQVAAYFGWSCGDSNARRVTRVSLSDWLALQASIRGFENPRLLRDRPSDGAAMAVKIYAVIFGALRAGHVVGERLLCADCGGDLGDHGRSKIMRNAMPL